MTKLREADAMLPAEKAVAQVVQALGVSEQTFISIATRTSAPNSPESSRPRSAPP